jgi:hypothetical protein
VEITEAAFRGVHPSAAVRRLDRRHADYNKTIFGYLGTRVTDDLIRVGRDHIRKHRTLLADIERRKAYCCFNTPLARILNEQIRPQLGRGWGEDDDPDCSGIAVEDFERIDWERVNLDEWLAILAETGNYPPLEDLDLEELTGTGSEYDLSDEREDAAERSDTRSDGLDSDEARWEAETELWESTLPALP